MESMFYEIVDISSKIVGKRHHNSLYIIYSFSFLKKYSTHYITQEEFVEKIITAYDQKSSSAKLYTWNHSEKYCLGVELN